MTPTKPEDALVLMLPDRLLRWALSFGTSNTALAYDLREAADAITTLLERERRATEALELVERYFHQDGHSVPQVLVSEVLRAVRAALTGETTQDDGVVGSRHGLG